MMNPQGVTMDRNQLAHAMLFGCLLLLVPALPRPARAQAATAAPAAATVSGMFTFLKEGEFVQLTVDDGKLSGFVSRFGDTESDKGQFIDQFFEKASLEGDHLHF